MRSQQYTHFASIPFVQPSFRKRIAALQQNIIEVFKQKNLHKSIKINDPNLMHITLFMLSLPNENDQLNAKNILQTNKKQYLEIMQKCKFTASQIKYFSYPDQKYPNKNIGTIYLDIVKDQHYENLQKFNDNFIRALIKNKLLDQSDLKNMYVFYDKTKQMYYKQDPHITLFHCNYLWESPQFFCCYNKIKDSFKGNILQCDFIDISTRWKYDSTKFYYPLNRIYLKENQYKKMRRQDIQQ